MSQLPSSSSSSSPLPSPSGAPAPGSTKLVVVAIVVALLAVVLVNVYIEAVKRSVREGQFTVYRLLNHVRPGDKLSVRDVHAVAVPESFRDAFSDALGADGLEARLGEVFLRHAERNDVVTYDLFLEPDENELDRRITTDMRLIALPVNSKTLPGALRPGMYVDLQAVFPGPGVRGPNVLPVMERVQVMAVGARSIIDEQAADRGRNHRIGRYNTISIEVTPQEATEMSKIQKMIVGDFELHLRKPGDTGRPYIPDGGINPAVLQLLQRPVSSSAR